MRLAYENVENEREWTKDVRACKIKRWSKERSSQEVPDAGS